jgi:hypothetical protein
MKKSPLNFGFGSLTGMNSITGIANMLRSRKNKTGGSQNAIMTKLNEISTKLDGGTPPVSSAPQGETAGTTGLVNSAEDVSQTMIDPTEVNESMMGKNDIVGNQTALMHKKDQQHTHEKPQWRKDHEAKFQAKKDKIAAEKARLLKITQERRKKIYGK